MLGHWSVVVLTWKWTNLKPVVSVLNWPGSLAPVYENKTSWFHCDFALPPSFFAWSGARLNPPLPFHPNSWDYPWFDWRKVHMWGPFEKHQHVFSCNIWVHVAPMFFTLMDLPCSFFLAWRTLCCPNPWVFGCNTHAFPSWCCSLCLGWKIVNNNKDCFNPCLVDLWDLFSIVLPLPSTPFVPKETPSLVHASLGTLALNLPCMAFWLCLEGVSEFRKYTGFQFLICSLWSWNIDFSTSEKSVHPLFCWWSKFPP